MGTPRARDEPNEHAQHPHDQRAPEPTPAIDVEAAREDRGDKQREKRGDQASEGNDRTRVAQQELEHKPGEQRAQDRKHDETHDEAHSSVDLELITQNERGNDEADRGAGEAEEPTDEESRHALMEAALGAGVWVDAGVALCCTRAPMVTCWEPRACGFTLLCPQA